MDGLYIGIDAGTQGVKAVIWGYSVSSSGAQPSVVARGSAPCTMLSTDAPGRAEQDPATWIIAVQQAVRAALSSMPQHKCGHQAIRGIGVSGQQHGLVVLDADCRVLRPAKLWCDTESAAEAKHLSQMLKRELVPSFTITKLLWLRNHEPEIWARVAHVLLPHDYINWWLCGRMCMEVRGPQKAQAGCFESSWDITNRSNSCYSSKAKRLHGPVLLLQAGDASGTGLLNLSNRQWDTDAIALVDKRVASWLPPLVSHNEVRRTAACCVCIPVRMYVPVAALLFYGRRWAICVQVQLSCVASLFSHHPFIKICGTRLCWLHWHVWDRTWTPINKGDYCHPPSPQPSGDRIPHACRSQ
jgi:xylulokinase